MKSVIAPILVVSCIGPLVGCAGDASPSKMRMYLGSELVADADGMPQRCTNFYSDLDSDDLDLPINRDKPCPAEGALGACELPVAASGEHMTQDEVVHYQGAEFETLREGDACSGGGIWSKPYPKDTAGSNEGGGY